MSEIIYNAVEKNGIEFYVSNDGETTGMSVRGLARCCGIAPSTLRSVIANVEGGSSTIEKLKPFAGKVFVRIETGDSENNAKVIYSEFCAALIAYYAYESKNAANETAKEILNKFVIKGIDKWIKQSTGFEEKEDSTIKKLNQILEVLLPYAIKTEKIEAEVSELRPIVEEYKVVKDGIHASFRGVETLIEHLTNEDEAPQLKSGNLYTLSQWLQTKHVSIDYASLRKFGRTVSETFKTCTVSVPGKKNVKKPNGKWSCNCTAYSEEHFPILEMALNQFMQN